MTELWGAGVAELWALGRRLGCGDGGLGGPSGGWGVSGRRRSPGFLPAQE